MQVFEKRPNQEQEYREAPPRSVGYGLFGRGQRALQAAGVTMPERLGVYQGGLCKACWRAAHNSAEFEPSSHSTHAGGEHEVVPPAARRQRERRLHCGACCSGCFYSQWLGTERPVQNPAMLGVERAIWAQSLAAEAVRMHGDRCVDNNKLLSSLTSTDPLLHICRIQIHWEHGITRVDWDRRLASFERPDGSRVQAAYDLLVAAGELCALLT